MRLGLGLKLFQPQGGGLLSPPSIPTSFFLKSVSSGSVTLIWSANSEENLSHYNLYRSTTPGFIPDNPGDLVNTIPAGTETYTDSGLLSDGTRYYYRLSAVNTLSLESGYTSEVEAIPQVVVIISPPSQGPPSWVHDGIPNGQQRRAKVTAKKNGGGLSAPANLIGAGSDGQIEWQWDAVVGAESYVVYHTDQPTLEVTPGVDESPTSNEAVATPVFGRYLYAQSSNDFAGIYRVDLETGEVIKLITDFNYNAGWIVGDSIEGFLAVGANEASVNHQKMFDLTGGLARTYGPFGTQFWIGLWGKDGIKAGTGYSNAAFFGVAETDVNIRTVKWSDGAVLRTANKSIAGWESRTMIDGNAQEGRNIAVFSAGGSNPITFFRTDADWETAATGKHQLVAHMADAHPVRNCDICKSNGYIYFPDVLPAYSVKRVDYKITTQQTPETVYTPGAAHVGTWQVRHIFVVEQDNRIYVMLVDEGDTTRTRLVWLDPTTHAVTIVGDDLISGKYAGIGPNRFCILRNKADFIMLDNFDDVDNTSLDVHTPDIGAFVWQEISGNWNIDAAQGSAERSTTGNQEIATVNLGISNLKLFFTVGWLNGGDMGWVVRRKVSDSSYWLVQLGSTLIQIFEYDGVTFTNRASTGLSTLTNGGSFHGTIEVNGTTITAKIYDGNTVKTVTYASATRNQTETIFGIRENGTVKAHHKKFAVVSL